MDSTEAEQLMGDKADSSLSANDRLVASGEVERFTLDCEDSCDIFVGADFKSVTEGVVSLENSNLETIDSVSVASESSQDLGAQLMGNDLAPGTYSLLVMNEGDKDMIVSLRVRLEQGLICESEKAGDACSEASTGFHDECAGECENINEDGVGTCFTQALALCHELPNQPADALVRAEEYCVHRHRWASDPTGMPNCSADDPLETISQSSFCNHTHRFELNQTTRALDPRALDYCRNGEGPLTREIFEEHFHVNAGSGTTGPF